MSRVVALSLLLTLSCGTGSSDKSGKTIHVQGINLTNDPTLDLILDVSGDAYGEVSIEDIPSNEYKTIDIAESPEDLTYVSGWMGSDTLGTSSVLNLNVNASSTNSLHCSGAVSSGSLTTTCSGAPLAATGSSSTACSDSSMTAAINACSGLANGANQAGTQCAAACVYSVDTKCGIDYCSAWKNSCTQVAALSSIGSMSACSAYCPAGC